MTFDQDSDTSCDYELPKGLLRRISDQPADKLYLFYPRLLEHASAKYARHENRSIFTTSPYS